MITESQIVLCGHGSGNPSTKNMKTYLSTRYSTFASNGKRKGVVCVRRPKNFSDIQRSQFHDDYSTLLGRNVYNQNLREYVYTPYPKTGKYYSDCSSSGAETYRRCGLNIGLLNTAGIYESSKFETVPVVIENGHIKNPEILKVADAILFVGNDPSRPLQIGHVEYVFDVPNPDEYHWVNDGNNWYYQNNLGENVHGWKKIKETDGEYYHWYYFDSKGKMLTGVLHDGTDIYYLTESGPLEGACCKTEDSGRLVVWNITE